MALEYRSRPSLQHTARKLLYRHAACNGRCAGKGEFVFARTHRGQTLQDGEWAVKRQVLPVFGGVAPAGPHAGPVPAPTPIFIEAGLPLSAALAFTFRVLSRQEKGICSTAIAIG